MQRALLALPWLVVTSSASLGWAQEADVRQNLRRSLAEYLFFDAQLGVRQRAVLYAEDAEEGPGGRTELRFFMNGRYQSGPTGPLGGYVGLGVVGRPALPQNQGIADPLADPYDDFDALQNVRLYGAHLQYTLRNDAAQPILSVRAGRLTDFDRRARLLLFDGIRLATDFGPMTASAYGGRRAVLDRDFSDDRNDVSAQMVAGVALDGTFADFSATAGYRFEEVHRASLRLSYSPEDRLGLGLTSEVVFGGTDALTADATIFGIEDEGSTAIVVRLDGDYASLDGKTGIYVVSELQLGRDPVVYGRSGRGPSEAEIDVALRSTMADARLDRLFLGAAQPHIFAEAGIEQWFSALAGISGGVWARIPLGEDAKRSLQPQVLEAWLGPELALSEGRRVAVQGRLALEDPGEPGGTFSLVGDGQRQLLSVVAFAEVPIRLFETWRLALRPELSGLMWNAEGPLSDVENQLGVSGGLLATLRASTDFRVALRYGFASLPSFTASEVNGVHDLELWVGGSY